MVAVQGLADEDADEDADQNQKRGPEADAQEEQGFYLPIQRVCRPSHEFRGFQGQIEGGSVRVGDQLTSLPSGEKAHVRSIFAADRQVQEAVTGQPVTIALDREVDVSRGCVLESGSGLRASDSFETEILWMDDQPLSAGKNFIVKLGTKKIPGIITKIKYKIDINTGEHKPADVLQKNEIAVCDAAVTEPVVVDTFKNHRTMGELILIDRISHMTSACGIVTEVHTGAGKGHPAADRTMRASLNWQTPLIIEFRPEKDGSSLEALEEAEFVLTRNGRHTYLYHPDEGEDYVRVLRHLRDTGLIILLVLDKGQRPDDRLSSEESYKLWEEISPEKGAASPERIADTIFHLTVQNMMIESSNWII